MIRTTVPLTVMMRDPVYAEAVMRGIAVRWREFRVRCEKPGCDTERKNALGERPTAVLTDAETMAEALRAYPDEPLFVIGEPSGTERGNVMFLSPFAGARELGAEILAELGREGPAEETDVFCVFVCSAAGGVGLSTVAAALARTVRSLRNGPALCLSCEPYPGGWRLFRGPDNGRTIEEYLFRLASPFGRALPEAYLREDVGGVRFFASNGSYNELLGMEPEEAEAFRKAVFASAADGTVVIDAPSPDARKLEWALNAAHALVVVGDGSAETEMRNTALEAQLLERFAFRKILRVVNETRPEKLFGAVIGEDDFVLPYDPASMEPGGICLEKSFGSGVREIAEELERIRAGGTAGDGTAERDGALYGGDRRGGAEKTERRRRSGLR